MPASKGPAHGQDPTFSIRPVGYGLDNTPQDISAAKRKLRELGFYKPRDTGMGDDFDAGFDAAIQNFQSRAGLRVDGVMKPGGETERNIEAYRTGEGFEAQPHPTATRLKDSVGAGGANAPEDVIAAKRALAASGRYGYDRTRPPSPYTDEKLVEAMRRLARDHDLFESGTIDPDSPVFQAMIREAEDGIRGVFPPSIAERKEGETQTAALPFLIPLALAGARLAAPHIARMAGSTAARIAGPNGARSILGAAAAGALGQAANDAGKRPGAKHRMQTDVEGAQTPPFPGEPLKPFPPFVTPIPEERGPSVTTTPIPKPARPQVETYPAEEPRKPEIEIFPDMSDEFEKWIITENSRGGEDLQQKDVQQIIDRLFERIRTGNSPFEVEHIGGGYTVPDEKGERKYMKELVIRPGITWPETHKRPDISLLVDGIHEDINVADTWKDNTTPTAREARNAKIMDSFKVALGRMRHTRFITKSKGISDEDYMEMVDELIDELFAEWTKAYRERNE